MKKTYFNSLKAATLSAFLLAGGSFGAYAQDDYTPGPATHEVENTENLAAFIEQATVFSGDTILLVSDSYLVTDTIMITKDITFLGDPRNAARPVLAFEGTGVAFQPASGGLTMNFSGFDMQGIWTDDAGEEQRASILEYGRTNEFGAQRIVFDDVHATGFSKGIELYYNQSQVYEEIVINDVIFSDINEWVFDPRINIIKDVDITNSTFFNTGGFLKNPSFEKINEDDGTVEREEVAQNILIDHNTFYNVVGPAPADALLQVNDPKDGSVTLIFSNNIVHTLRDPENTRPFRINELAGTFAFDNNLFFNFESARDGGQHNIQAVNDSLENVILTDNIFEPDPAFADAAAANFAIPEDSPLLAVSTTGGVIGDPEWAGEEDGGTTNPDGPKDPDYEPGLATHEVDNTEDLAAFIEQATVFSGDTILLVSDSYLVTDTIMITKDITFLGDPRNAARPVLAFEGTGVAFQPASGGLTMNFSGFDMQGIWTDDAGEEQRASILEYGRTNEFGAQRIVFDDVHATGFSKGIELYYNQSQVYEEIVINDVIFSDINEWVFDPRINIIKDVDITNSTFFNTGGFLKNPSFEKINEDDGTVEREEVAQNILIDHNTFYNVVGPAPADALLQVNDPKDGSVTLIFSNNIVHTLRDPENTRPFRINELAGTFAFDNNLFFNFESARDGGQHNIQAVNDSLENVILTDNIFEPDPAFADAAGGDFTLPEDSPLLAVSTTGGVIGDPEWAGEEDGGTVDPGEVMVNEINITAADDKNTITSKGGFINLSAVVLPANAADRTVTWSVDDETIATVNENGSVSALADGVVTVTATANDGSGISDTYEITISGQGPTAVKPWEEVIAAVYPNPASEQINITAKTPVQVTISTLTGDVVRSGIVNGSGSFNVAGLQNGLYVVLIKSGTKVQSFKLFKE